MRYVTTALFIIYIFQLGCGTTSGGADSRAAEPAGGRTTHDGLVEVETEGPGKLFLREDHGIGGYDAVAVVPSWVAYSRSSAKLKSELEDVYLASLEQTIWDLADDADISIVRQPGDCVLMIGAGFVNVDLAKSSTAKVLGNMVLVIEFQDSTRKQSLLRYAAPQRIEREPDGVPRARHVHDSFNQMIDDVNIILALRQATVGGSAPRPGCQGDLLEKARVLFPDESLATSSE
jgi:hypothetical protein